MLGVLLCFLGTTLCFVSFTSRVLFVLLSVLSSVFPSSLSRWGRTLGPVCLESFLPFFSLCPLTFKGPGLRLLCEVPHFFGV